MGSDCLKETNHLLSKWYLWVSIDVLVFSSSKDNRTVGTKIRALPSLICDKLIMIEPLKGQHTWENTGIFRASVNSG